MIMDHDDDDDDDDDDMMAGREFSPVAAVQRFLRWSRLNNGESSFFREVRIHDVV